MDVLSVQYRTDRENKIEQTRQRSQSKYTEQIEQTGKTGQIRENILS